MTNSELVLAIALDVSKAKNEDQQTVKLLYWVDMIKMLGAKEALVERAAQCIAHRACCGSEHDPLHGKLHGYCVVCGVPWPCEYVGPLPVVAAKVEPAPAVDYSNPPPNYIVYESETPGLWHWHDETQTAECCGQLSGVCDMKPYVKAVAACWAHARGQK